MQTFMLKHSCYCLLGLALIGCLTAGSPARAEEPLDWRREHDPEFSYPQPVLTFPQNMLERWQQCLARPEHEMKGQTAESMLRLIRLGMTGAESTADQLLANFNDLTQPIGVRAVSAEVLIAMDIKTAADSFARQAGTVPAMALIVEPALAKWDFQPLREIWLKRIADPKTPRTHMLLAIQSLATVSEQQAIAPLTEIVLDSRARPEFRTASAKALATLRPSGNEPTCRQLLASGRQTLIEFHCAAELLQQHSGTETMELLHTLIDTGPPIAAASAAARILELDAAQMQRHLDQLITAHDDQLRLRGVQGLLANDSAENIVKLGAMLDDEHLHVRRAARQALENLASQSAWDQPVRETAMQVLTGDSWRQLEQAIVLIVALDHKPAAPRLIELLDHPHPRVLIPAGWGLRHLNIEETYAPLFARVEKLAAVLTESGPTQQRYDYDQQVAHLFEMLAPVKYPGLEPIFRRYVPLNYNVVQSRQAAMWGLGYVLENKPDETLAGTIRGRLGDAMYESLELRSMAALTLGRMGSTESVSNLRTYYHPGTTEMVGQAAGWSLNRLTGEEIPPPQTGVSPYSDQLLQPLDAEN